MSWYLPAAAGPVTNTILRRIITASFLLSSSCDFKEKILLAAMAIDPACSISMNIKLIHCNVCENNNFKIPGTKPARSWNLNSFATSLTNIDSLNVRNPAMALKGTNDILDWNL